MWEYMGWILWDQLGIGGELLRTQQIKFHKFWKKILNS
jgi:hypothetical protein